MMSTLLELGLQLGLSELFKNSGKVDVLVKFRSIGKSWRQDITAGEVNGSVISGEKRSQREGNN